VPDSQGKLIYIVDDEKVIATTLALVLSQFGYRTQAFTTAEQTIPALDAEIPSVLLTDVDLPGMNGFELAIRYRELCPDCKILLFSGHLDTGTLLKASQALGHDFKVLPKPVHPKEMLEAIEELFAYE
jgi:FixJ family two-component response regulator